MATPTESWMKAIEARLSSVELQLLRYRGITPSFSPPSTMPSWSSDSSGSPADAPATSPSNPQASAGSAGDGPGAPGPDASTPASPGGGGSSSSSSSSPRPGSQPIYSQAECAAKNLVMSNLHGVNYRMDWMGWYVPRGATEEIRSHIKSASLAAHRAWVDVVLPLLPPHYPWDGTPAGAIEALVLYTRATSDTPMTLNHPMTLKQAIEVCKASNDAREEFVERPVARYGYCPICGAQGLSRERRPNGNDMCDYGHTYPSSKATNTPKGL